MTNRIVNKEKDLRTTKTIQHHQANLTDQDSTILTAFPNQILTWNFWCLYVSYNKYFSRIHTTVLTSIKDNPESLKDWDQAIAKMKENIEIEFDHFLPAFEGGLKPLTMENTYINEFKKQILDLKPIEINSDEQIEEHSDYNSVEQLIMDVKEEIKKGNRVSFKLMQELQATLEKLPRKSTEHEQGLIDESVEKYKKKTEDFIKLAIQALDSMDLIYQSALKINLTEWAEQIEKVINEFLQTLEAFGIEQLEVQDVFFDGESMISIGTVPPEYAPHLEKYQVYSVHERGFRFKDSRKLIREAKVTTIY